MQNADEIINRLKLYFRLKTDTSLAEKLGVSQSAVSLWRSRNSVDLKLIIAKCQDMNFNWLFTGEGEMIEMNQVLGLSKQAKDSEQGMEYATALRKSEDRIKELEKILAAKEKLLAKLESQLEFAERMLKK